MNFLYVLFVLILPDTIPYLVLLYISDTGISGFLPEVLLLRNKLIFLRNKLIFFPCLLSRSPGSRVKDAGAGAGPRRGVCGGTGGEEVGR